MQVTLTTHKSCPECGTEAIVEVDGFFSSICMVNTLNHLDKVGGMLTASCGHTFYVEPKPKKPTFIQRLKNHLRRS